MAKGVKYQGREQTTTLQAPTKKALNVLVSSTRSTARSLGMDNFKVLESGKDPDGGYRAIVTAHNFNPITWIKSKVGSEKSKASARTKMELDREDREIAKQSRTYEKEEARKRKLAEEEVESSQRIKDREEDIKRKREVEEAGRSASHEESIRRAKLTPTQRVEEKISEAKQKKELRAVSPTPMMKISKGVGKMGGAGLSLVRSLGTRSAEVREEYGEGGKLISRSVTRRPRGAGYHVISSGDDGGMIPAGRLLTPGGGGGNLGGDLSHLRSMILPGTKLGLFGGSGAIAVSTGEKSIISGLTENQAEVYTAIREGHKDMDSLEVATGLSKSSITRALKKLEKKGLIKGG